MDDMTMLAELGSQLDHEPPATLARQRHRLIDAGQGRPARHLRHWPFLAGSAAVATAAAVAIVVMDPHAAAHRPTAPPPAALTAAIVLNRAADVAEQDPDVTPTAHQWIYTRVAEYGTKFATPKINDLWERFDGQQEADVEGGKLVLTVHHTADNGASEGPSAEYAFLRNLPTDPQALLAALIRQTDWGTHKPTIHEEFGTVVGAVWNTQIGVAPPAARAAIYRALATFPGVRIEQVTDGLGGHDIGVTEGNGNVMLLLNPTDYRVVGFQDKNPLQTFPNGKTIPATEEGMVVQADKVVDNPGER